MGNPEEKKTVVFSILVDQKSVEFSGSAMGAPRGTLQYNVKKS